MTVRKRKLALMFAIVCGWSMAAYAENLTGPKQDDAARARMGEIKDQAKYNKMINSASEVYSAIVKGSHGQVPSSVLKDAKCIAILPDVYTGALIVGGTHGGGLASCKDSKSEWSQPAAISFTQGSLGLQAGAKSTDLVLFFRTNEAENALKRGEFALGTDVSAVAGKFDSSFDTSNIGIVAYSRTKGVFAGASVSGGKISQDKKELENYYGKNVDYVALLDGRILPDASGYSNKLTRLFP